MTLKFKPEDFFDEQMQKDHVTSTKDKELMDFNPLADWQRIFAAGKAQITFNKWLEEQTIVYGYFNKDYWQRHRTEKTQLSARLIDKKDISLPACKHEEVKFYDNDYEDRHYYCTKCAQRLEPIGWKEI